jgi:hypothetical protein
MDLLPQSRDKYQSIEWKHPQLPVKRNSNAFNSKKNDDFLGGGIYIGQLHNIIETGVLQ